MVRSYKKVLGSGKYNDYSPTQLEKAVQAVKKGTSLRKAAKEFGQP